MTGTEGLTAERKFKSKELQDIYEQGWKDALSQPPSAQEAEPEGGWGEQAFEIIERHHRNLGEWAKDASSGGRDKRQKQVAEWCAAAFGADHQASVPQRGLRMLEEAIEAYQATTGTAEVAHRLIDYIFTKEPGELFQELGGLGVTTLALAAAAGLSADKAEMTEVDRVLSKPLEHFWQRNKVKNEAGFDATAYPSAAPLAKRGI